MSTARAHSGPAARGDRSRGAPRCSRAPGASAAGPSSSHSRIRQLGGRHAARHPPRSPRPSASTRRPPIRRRAVELAAASYDGTTEWMIFDRPAGSERDLVVLAVGVRSDDRAAPPRWRSSGRRSLRRGALGRLPLASRAAPRVVARRRHRVRSRTTTSPFEDMLRVCDPRPRLACGLVRSSCTDRMAIPVRRSKSGSQLHRRCDIRRPTHLSPLRHALTQVDGAAMFDADGVLRRLGVRLMPSSRAEESVDSARRHAPHLSAALQP